MEHSDELIRGSGGIGERPQDIENRPHAQLLPHWRRVLHRRVVARREHEADSGLADAGRDLRRREQDVRAQRFEYVRAARFRRHRTVAVLGYAGSGAGRDEHRRGRDVERMRSVAARADDVEQILAVGYLDPGCEFAHDLRRCGDLAHRFLLDAQADRQRCDHHGGGFAAHDLAHHGEHLVVEDFAVLDRALQRFLHGDGHDRSFTECSGNWTAARGPAVSGSLQDGTVRPRRPRRGGVHP